ncbi:hypothetical protein [Micromonospora sp. CB01531]|nr:hypothetical protein [Micromonospora sp. CB01531]
MPRPAAGHVTRARTATREAGARRNGYLVLVQVTVAEQDRQ